MNIEHNSFPVTQHFQSFSFDKIILHFSSLLSATINPIRNVLRIMYEYIIIVNTVCASNNVPSYSP